MSPVISLRLRFLSIWRRTSSKPRNLPPVRQQLIPSSRQSKLIREFSLATHCFSSPWLLTPHLFTRVPKETGSSHLLCSQPVAMAVELEFLLSQYADISEDHSQLMATFKKKAEAVVFANKRLSKLIPKAKNLLINGHPIPGSPLSLLSEVKRQLTKKGGGTSGSGALTSLPDNEYVKT